jgi:hypothetical protein
VCDLYCRLDKDWDCRNVAVYIMMARTIYEGVLDRDEYGRQKCSIRSLEQQVRYSYSIHVSFQICRNRGSWNMSSGRRLLLTKQKATTVMQGRSDG